LHTGWVILEELHTGCIILEKLHTGWVILERLLTVAAGTAAAAAIFN
jgi:hypothetical protein